MKGKVRKAFDEPQELISKIRNEYAVKTGVKQAHKFYGYKIGHLRDPSKISRQSIEDPESQRFLSDAVFQEKDSSVCFREKSIRVFFEKEFSISELQHAIANFTETGRKFIKDYIARANFLKNDFAKRFKRTVQYSYGCCLAIAVYSGIQAKHVYEAERISRVGSSVIKLYAEDRISQIKQTDSFQYYMCIGQWLIKALNCIDLHWGKVTRCVDLKPDEYAIYDSGNIVTWLQFSSSSSGQLSQYFATRNTRFIIYSISGRSIMDFSEYKDETEVLFKPFSHFLVYKKQKIVEHGQPKTIIYMREIFLGQSNFNLLWVDDFIFDKDWQNKQIMEAALYREPFLNIIPKVSTQCAMAFLRSELGKNRSKKDFRIITDMNRYNQEPYHDAGARFVKQVKQLKVQNDIMIFTSIESTAVKNLKEQGVDPSSVKITIGIQEAVKFLTFK